MVSVQEKVDIRSGDNTRIMKHGCICEHFDLHILFIANEKPLPKASEFNAYVCSG